ncbi:MAG: KpsF/GutQ family sugar-phosphate isomerase, partial [Alphaproteobacteria bacterium]|nr:KpsF/GutQ family sugar-phosphate isomerase [Alphaproteobacteria bacterium]
RIVVTGMGKSGHVARKIAATFASTGTPAIFVHPAEASHGDMGMITQGDAVIALSNSGETTELANLIQHTRSYNIPLIGITSSSLSSLAQISDVALILPDVGEACPIGLAPTTSTTMMMALGDALATTLLTKKKFSPDQFSLLHPGGSLGKQLLKINQIMHTGEKIPVVEADVFMSEALLIMSEKGFGCVGVLNAAGFLIGVITDGDLRRHMSDNLLKCTAKEIMTPRPKMIREKSLVTEAIAFINKNKITSLFVCADESPETHGVKPIGIIHVHDCLRV